MKRGSESESKVVKEEDFTVRLKWDASKATEQQIAAWIKNELGFQGVEVVSVLTQDEFDNCRFKSKA